MGSPASNVCQLSSVAGTATAVAGAVTYNQQAGQITSEALSTAAGADYSLTLTNSLITASSLVFANAANGTNSAGGPLLVHNPQPAAGSVVLKVRNSHASVALNGTILINFYVI